MDEMADALLRIPPQPLQREEHGQFISKDEQLEDFDECSYVFTDITMGNNDEVCTLLGCFIFIPYFVNCIRILLYRENVSYRNWNVLCLNIFYRHGI